MEGSETPITPDQPSKAPDATVGQSASVPEAAHRATFMDTLKNLGRFFRGGGTGPSSAQKEQMVKDTLEQNPITAESAEQTKADTLKAPPSMLTPRELSFPPPAHATSKEELDQTIERMKESRFIDNKKAQDLRENVKPLNPDTLIK